MTGRMTNDRAPLVSLAFLVCVLVVAGFLLVRLWEWVLAPLGSAVSG